MPTGRPIIRRRRPFLDACDRLGMLVMDEHRQTSSTPEGLRQLTGACEAGSKSSLCYFMVHRQ